MYEIDFGAYSSEVWIFHTCAKFLHLLLIFHTKCKLFLPYVKFSHPMWNFHLQGHDLLKGCVISSINAILVLFEICYEKTGPILFKELVTFSKWWLINGNWAYLFTFLYSSPEGSQHDYQWEQPLQRALVASLGCEKRIRKNHFLLLYLLIMSGSPPWPTPTSLRPTTSP